MLILLNPNSKKEEIDNLKDMMLKYDVSIHESNSIEYTTLLVTGETYKIDIDRIKALGIVRLAQRLTPSYNLASKKHKNDYKVIEIGNVKIGKGNFCKIAGPCSVESEEQIIDIAQKVKDSGANILRGGAFKPRTSPYSFQGLQKEGIKMLLLAKKITGLPIVTEITDISQIEILNEIDILQVGSRNMQNFSLLKELGKIKKPILLKRGFSSTIEEMLLSAEYIMNEGNDQIILCERGIKTFDNSTRSTLDISCVPIVKEKSCLPIITDPSHSTGNYKYVKSMTLASVAAGCDGIMIEVHNKPQTALSDGNQSITTQRFSDISREVDKLLTAKNCN